MKKNDSNKVTGKDLLSSMGEFKNIYMNDLCRSHKLNQESSSLDEHRLENVDKSYLEVNYIYLFLFDI